MEDLQKAALRPRHWKQLLRLAGENVHVVANDGLVKMSLGQLIEFGLHRECYNVTVEFKLLQLIIEITV